MVLSCGAVYYGVHVHGCSNYFWLLLVIRPLLLHSFFSISKDIHEGHGEESV